MNRFTILLATLVAAIAFGVIATTASAHHNTVSVTPSCTTYEFKATAVDYSNDRMVVVTKNNLVVHAEIRDNSGIFYTDNGPVPLAAGVYEVFLFDEDDDDGQGDGSHFDVLPSIGSTFNGAADLDANWNGSANTDDDDPGTNNNQDQDVQTDYDANLAASPTNCPKVDVCHLEGNGSYNLINIDQSALASHLAHGDVLPTEGGCPVILDECTNIEGLQSTVPEGFVQIDGTCVSENCDNSESYAEENPVECNPCPYDEELSAIDEECVPPVGSITIVKDTNPEMDNGPEFDFDGDFGDFDLEDDEFIVFDDLSAGNYSVSENLPSGWQLDDISCIVNGGTTVSIDDNDEEVTVHLVAGGSARCTFENSPIPTTPTPTPTPPVTITNVIVTECVGNQLITRTNGVITNSVSNASQCAPQVVERVVTIQPPKSGDAGLKDTAESLPWSSIAGVVALAGVLLTIGLIKAGSKLGPRNPRANYPKG